jgi:O-antigen/teichoic acid export membrane protein
VGRIPSELRKAHFKKTLFIEMIQYSAPLILNNISWWVVHSSNKLLVKGNLGPDDLGLFTAASKIPAFVNVIINVFSQAWGISSTKEYESSNDSKFYSSVLDVYSFICFGASIALISIIKPFMHLYVGAEFYEAWRIVPILLAAAAFASISYYYGSLYGVLKDSKRNMISTLVAAIVNLVVAWIGIKTIGVCGAAVGTLASYIVMSTIRKIDIEHHIPIDIDWRRFLLTCLLVLIQSILVTLDFHGYVVSAITVFIFILLYKNMIIDLFAVIKGFLSGKKKDNGGETE